MSRLITKCGVKNLDDESPAVMRHVLEEIVRDPLLVERFVAVYVELTEDKTYSMSPLELSLFSSMKVLFDDAYVHSISGDMKPGEYVSVVRVVKELYESMCRALDRSKVRQRDVGGLEGMGRLELPIDSDEVTISIKKRGEVIDV